MVDLITLAHALARLEALLEGLLSPEQHHECVALLPALHAAIGILARPSLGSVASDHVSDQTLRLRFRLTRREVEVLRLLLSGESNSCVAHALDISEHTARHHTERILRKLRVRSRARLPAAIGARRE